MLTNRYLHLLLVSLTAVVMTAQPNARTAYVLEYSQIAVDEMNRGGILRRLRWRKEFWKVVMA